MPFETINTETMYLGKAFDVHRDQVKLPDGKIAMLDVVVHPGAVTMIPIDSRGRILFVRQYRHPAKQELLELPAGTLNEGESPEKCALREVREEVGMSAEHLERIGEFYLAPGYSTEYMYVYLATELSPDPLEGDEDEFIIVESFAIREVRDLVSQGVIQDAKSLAALYLAQPYLR